MAVIEVNCQGVNWQADFEPLIPRLYAHFTRCFRGENDYEELRQRAVLYFMHRFMKYWAPGKTFRIATWFIVQHARYGRCGILPLPNKHHKSAKAQRLGKRLQSLKARADRVVEYLSWKEMLARLRERERRIIQLYVARYGWEEIKARLGVSDYYIKQAIVRAYELLNN